MLKDIVGRELKIGQICLFDKYLDTRVLVMIVSIKDGKVTYIELPIGLKGYRQSYHARVGTSTAMFKFFATTDFKFSPILDNLRYFGELTDRITGKKQSLVRPDIDDQYQCNDAKKFNRAFNTYLKEVSEI